MTNSIYEMDLDKNSANYEQLTPLSFIKRAGLFFPAHEAVVYGDTRRTWGETYERCRRVASALRARGVDRGATVAAMLPNIPEMLEAHFAVPMSGGVLTTINTRLDARTVAFILEHSDAKVLLTDREFSSVVGDALSYLDREILVVDVIDPLFGEGELLGSLTYDELIALADPGFECSLPEDEWDAISLNYTSGTTGNPKGVVYHHRGAYLNAANNALTWNMGMHPRYLWTLPMFHCNGWCFPWTLAMTVGTTICLRHVRDKQIFELIRKEQVTHFCGAPVVLNMLINAPDDLEGSGAQTVEVMTAGAAPPSAVIQGMEARGFRVTQVYGLTETYGPTVVSAWHTEWDSLPADARAQLKARQGIASVLSGDVIVANTDTLEPVPWDGETPGEILMRGNIVMKGYLKNPSTTAEAFRGGWFHSGDIAVCHPDGYIQIKDRLKDIIISGGENISSIEVEDVLFRHPGILEAAVVAKPDPKWGEHPCAFVTLKEGASLSAAEVIEYCREHMAHFKIPRTIVFGPLPKTSTGKVQKYVLRERARRSRQSS